MCFVLFLQCETKQSQSEDASATTEKQSTTLTAKAINDFRYNEYILSKDTEETVSNWDEFLELSKHIEFLKTADVTFFTQDLVTLQTFLNNMKTNIPDNINTKPVNARLLVLETRILKLHNDLTLDNIAVAEQVNSIQELLVASSNLNFVINKKLELEDYDIGRPE
ncbi:hypothetical protein [Winogradskyella maritima]|uniref:Uncharacterized protein n=1 Tax=Winogradskyella maritima TaxID=1517766 RepID=A0ABV8AEJ7_9FLAO